MSKKIVAILVVALMAMLLAPSLACAANVTLTLSPAVSAPGETVEVFGMADADQWVSIKVIDGDQSIIVFDAIKSDAMGNYSASFKVPPGFSGSDLIVVAGYNKNVDTKILTVSGGSGGNNDTTAPAWPGGSALTASNVAQTGLTLTWTSATDNVGVTSYRIFKDGSVYTTVASGARNCNVTGLSAGASYTFKVEAGDAAGNWSSNGPSVAATTDTASPTGPGSNSPGGGPTPAAGSATGSASVTPADGGKFSLGSDVSLEIPAGALSGTTEVKVAITKVNSPPAIPGGFSLLGSVFEFTVDGASAYSFNKPVTLTFTFDPDALAQGETPAVYYYDETSAQWVNLGGAISGNTVTVTVDHFTKFAVLALAKEETLLSADQPPAGPFSDVPASHWASGVIYELSASGCISGYPDGTFKPGDRISRAEFATVLVKAFQLPAASGKVFDDTAGHWARDYIGAAHAAGIVSGYSESSFGPDNPITREQMAMMIAKAAGLPEAVADITFTDSGQVSGWARAAVSAVTYGSIMQGYPDGTFAPLREATRAEAVTVIAKALG